MLKRTIITSQLHIRLVVTILFVVYFSLGTAIGYSFGIREEATNVRVLAQQGVQTLREQASATYVNPFDIVNAKNVEFPIEQLLGCRNWEECHDVCGDPTHFSACSTWAHGQGLVE